MLISWTLYESLCCVASIWHLQSQLPWRVGAASSWNTWGGRTLLCASDEGVREVWQSLFHGSSIEGAGADYIDRFGETSLHWRSRGGAWCVPWFWQRWQRGGDWNSNEPIKLDDNGSYRLIWLIWLILILIHWYMIHWYYTAYTAYTAYTVRHIRACILHTYITHIVLL